MHAGRALFVAVLACLAGAAARAEFRVTPDKENVVAGRLEGVWTADAALTARLLGTKPSQAIDVYEFIVRAEVAAAVPAKYAEFLKDKPIYLAGVMRRGGAEHPFILIAYAGNPRVVWFREREGDPMGDAESFNLVVAPARDRANDLLFIGGDFNNQPFRAYSRRPDAVPAQ